MAFTRAGQYGPNSMNDINDVPLPNTPVNVFQLGTTIPITLYTDPTKATQATNPVSTDTLGNLTFYADPGRYDLLCRGTDLTVSVLPDVDDLIALTSAIATIPAPGNFGQDARPAFYFTAPDGYRGDIVTIQLPADSPAGIQAFQILDASGNPIAGVGATGPFATIGTGLAAAFSVFGPQIELDPQSGPMSILWSATGNRLFAGNGAPSATVTTPAIVNDRYIRWDGGAGTYEYKCTVAGANGGAQTWVGIL